MPVGGPNDAAAVRRKACGLTALSTGGASRVNSSAAEVALVTATSTVPAGPAGEVAVICVAELTRVARRPGSRSGPRWPPEPVPETVTRVPPELKPSARLSAVTAGCQVLG